MSDRSNLFLLIHSIFFAGFILLRTQTTIETGFTLAAGIVVSVFGISFSLAQVFIIGSNVEAANFWRSTAGLIQSDDDFWWPTRTKSDIDLDFFHSRRRAQEGTDTRQGTQSIAGGGIVWRKLSPSRALGLWLPVSFGFLWVFALVWSIALLVAATTGFQIEAFSTSPPTS